jgi:DNA-binding transcriptional regulator YdaS (Cro superfamily)
MEIEEYLFRNKITKTDFAKRIGVSRPHFHQMLSGKKRITAETAFKIEKETQGAVTKEELRPDIFQ